MARRVLEVEAESRYCQRLRGPNARGMIMELNGGKLPVFSSIAKAYTVSERTAANVVALAESRNYDIVITGPRATAANTKVMAHARLVSSVETSDPGGGLW